MTRHIMSFMDDGYVQHLQFAGWPPQGWRIEPSASQISAANDPSGDGGPDRLDEGCLHEEPVHSADGYLRDEEAMLDGLMPVPARFSESEIERMRVKFGFTDEEVEALRAIGNTPQR
ncbi:hypothetical protein D3093_06355 [Azospirillum argentinense]|uniref:Uncharacterized protein n=1 Tax=Azospirillum argentinense TaxID=2970906 RepID=A0A4D8P7U2_9PROT|nr:hypothetical protein [Azospirillum argentinense]QCN94913.1 hypothetical protein D3093_06355 [Azospirillum argentinense]